MPAARSGSGRQARCSRQAAAAPPGSRRAMRVPLCPRRTAAERRDPNKKALRATSDTCWLATTGPSPSWWAFSPFLSRNPETRKKEKEREGKAQGEISIETTQFALGIHIRFVAAMPACRSEETQEKLAQCLTSLRCRLRVRCYCAECVAVSKNRDHRTPRGGSKHLAAMVLKETEDTNQTAANPTNQKVSCVATLPIPAGGFCRRSAAAQLMLAQEMCRQTALDDEPFDCADHDW